jgi:hypothetical protein
MIDFPRKLKGYYAGLPSRDNIHIYRDPPKSIYTRKKERVEFGDVKSFIEDDVTRYSDGIRKFQGGVNPSVRISYQNSGGGQKLMSSSNLEAKNPYKVIKDDAFRPPMFRQEDLLPLSRMNRPYTNRPGAPGIRGSFSDCGLAESIDKQPVQAATSVIVAGSPELPPSRSYIISTPIETCVDHNIKFDKNYETINHPKSSSVKAEYFDDEFAKNIQHTQLSNGHLPSQANKNSLVKASSSMPGTSLQDLQEMNSREINTNIKEHTLLEELYTNPSLNIYNSNNNYNVNGIIENPLSPQLSSSLGDINKLQQIHNELELERKNALISYYSPISDENRLITTQDPEYEFSKNHIADQLSSPLSSEYTIQGEKRLDKELTRQIREVNGQTNPSYFIKRNNEELMMERREKTKLNKQTHYNDFGAKPNTFTMDRQGLTNRLRRKS